MSKLGGWLTAGASAIIAVLAFVLYRRWKQDHVDTLTDALTVAKAERDVATLTERRDTLVESAEARESDIQSLDDQLDETQRVIVEARTGTKDLDADAVLAEYRRLGYTQ